MTPIDLAGVTLYDLEEIAGKLKTTTVSLRKAIKAGRLHARMLTGHKWWITEEDLAAFLRGETGEKK